MKTASYTKLTKTNTWGLRVEGLVTVGEVVLAKRRGERNGTRKTVTEIVWTGNGVTLCAFGNAPAKTVDEYGMSLSEATDGEYNDNGEQAYDLPY